MKRDTLVAYLDERLDIADIEDYSVNGLQVQGKSDVRKVGLATDAALSTYQKAAELGCDMLLTHHGLIWGQIRRVTGRDYEHIRFLLEKELNLYTAHLPLDIHPEIGNGAELARIVGLIDLKPFGKHGGINLGFSGRLQTPMSPGELAKKWQAELGGEPQIMAFGKDMVETVAVASGGASMTLPEAIERNIDCLATGEGKHQDHHLALEGQANVIYLGHYHSETLGVKALGKELESRLGLETVFIDEPTFLR